ncbi:hypothetical protein [Thalassospira alkalitolerans]|uniref:hypothetical protein n=1 Tax=Thalassospira alkalitolerans TaxID=1293890 RepID=UPI003AA7C5EF
MALTVGLAALPVICCWRFMFCPGRYPRAFIGLSAVVGMGLTRFAWLSIAEWGRRPCFRDWQGYFGWAAIPDGQYDAPARRAPGSPQEPSMENGKKWVAAAVERNTVGMMMPMIMTILQ